ncbi:MAG: site-specific DNA-methyltransferase [Clostridium sp.]|jgi:adenine-specific DNA-methyltransferase|nr:site-specific DNA-methyltransferase [Clostridium sp.]
MPTLEWIGKDKVVGHHQEVPFRVQEHLYTYPAGGESDNMIIHGDNLDALKALLPRYEGRVKCIYIDPPYNTGTEGWVYHDNVNDPKMQKWLGDTVGREGEDLSRHDKWLCMMYPRLKLLQRLLAEDGAIFISIDDNELYNLKLMMDEVFGASNFITNIIWEKRYTRSNNAKMFASVTDYVLMYRKSAVLSEIKAPRTAKNDAIYSNPDNDPRGVWTSVSCVNPATREQRPNLVYPMFNPITGEMVEHSTRAWKFEKARYEEYVRDNKLYWGIEGKNTYPRLKKFLSELIGGVVPANLWSHEETGTTDAGTKILNEILGAKTFDNPKPPTLIKRCVELVASSGDIILDSFAGSGTTAHAVLNMNKADGGNRKFILVEMENYAETITAERVRRVIDGYGDKEGTGGGFGYYELGDPLLFANGNINEAVPTEKIREYVWYMETKQPAQTVSTDANPYFLGATDGTAYYFHYEKNCVTTLDMAFLETIADCAERYIIYADQCALTDAELSQYNITFKKIPRDIEKL